MEHSKQTSYPGHIPALDGIRGLAILSVILFHYVDFLRAWFPGWIGVDLFFVLSGYLITGRLIATKGRPDYFRRFYRNRILRIFPLYYAVLIIFFILILFFVRHHQSSYAWYFRHWKSFFLFTENLSFIRFGFPADLSLLPLWSVAVEEQFYLFWPLLLFLLPADRKIRIRFFALAFGFVLLARCVYYFHTASPSLAYYNTFLHMDGLLAGSALCVLHEKSCRLLSRMLTPIALVLSVGLLSGSLLSKSASPHSPFFSTLGYSLLAILFSCLIDRAVRPGTSFIPRILNLRFLRFCGKISYGLYLVHVPILLFVSIRIYTPGVSRWPGASLLIYWISVAVSLVIAFTVSALSYRYYESRFLRLKGKID